ncbi:metalloregulator ArsR/SmtB family transcription factor [bacterium]|nr:metalloregulator ArsR/SmtB family transcription factor [bacterium]
MDAETNARFEARARIIKAMAHPTRLFIIDVLSHDRRCVCELTEMVGADISTVSKHLSILKNVGIISDEKEGTKIFYSLKTRCILNFFSCVESVLLTNAREQIRLVELK